MQTQNICIYIYTHTHIHIHIQIQIHIHIHIINHPEVDTILESQTYSQFTDGFLKFRDSIYLLQDDYISKIYQKYDMMYLKLQVREGAASSASFTTSCSLLRIFHGSAAASSRARAAVAWKKWGGRTVQADIMGTIKPTANQPFCGNRNANTCQWLDFWGYSRMGWDNPHQSVDFENNRWWMSRSKSC